jgi:hypothetical protein
MVSEAVEALPLATILGLPAIAGTVFGLWVLSIGLWRAGEAPVAFPVLMIAGWIVSFATFEPVLIVGGGVLILAGCAVAASRLLRAQ